ncbi:MAG TPA: hypothetical protein VFQ42_04300 [Mycobacterium sp.]|nr:hypothetical protein [Mycobacterium sp.]
MTARTLLGEIGQYTRYRELRGTVTEFLGDQADEYDVDSLTDAYRDAINAALEGTTISLHGDKLFADHPAPADAHDLIAAAIGSVDLGELASDHELA